MRFLIETLTAFSVVATIAGLMGWTVAGTDISALAIGIPLLVISFVLRRYPTNRTGRM